MHILLLSTVLQLLTSSSLPLRRLCMPPVLWPFRQGIKRVPLMVLFALYFRFLEEFFGENKNAEIAALKEQLAAAEAESAGLKEQIATLEAAGRAEAE